MARLAALATFTAGCSALVLPSFLSTPAQRRPTWRGTAAAAPRMAIDIDVSSAQSLVDSIPSLDSLGDAVSGAGDAIVAAKDGAIASASSLTQGLADAFNSATASALRPFQEASEGVQGALSSAQTEAVAELAAKAGGVAESAKGAVDAALSRLGTSTEEVAREEKQVVSALSATVAAIESVATPRTLFATENVAIVPLWLAMAFAPDNVWTKRIMSGLGPVTLAALLYAWLAFESLKDPASLEAFSNAVTDLGALTKGIGRSETGAATVWAHMVAQDLFVGRWIYLDGRRNGVWTSHSLLLTFLFGPCGVLSHLLTRGAIWVFKRDVKDIIDVGMLPAAASGGGAPPALAAVAESSKAKARGEEVVARAKEEAAGILKRAKNEAAQMVANAREARDTAVGKVGATAAEAGTSASAVVAEATSPQQEAVTS